MNFKTIRTIFDILSLNLLALSTPIKNEYLNDINNFTNDVNNQQNFTKNNNIIDKFENINNEDAFYLLFI